MDELLTAKHNLAKESIKVEIGPTKFDLSLSAKFDRLQALMVTNLPTRVVSMEDSYALSKDSTASYISADNSGDTDDIYW
ncbi:hypothetical protein PanWU01x14_157480 [Parasponia andersonii]|uniref:Uncharacterized protein n=1 Tax=Parasponia andersonii TaxID=3476 RepID=A0A2P5CF63_PARAD|nr:hypothetical protein PanWU01x14_157480 [Parasponia andersonii]